MKRKIPAILILFLTAVVWGFATVGQVLGGDKLPAMAFNACRFTLGAAVLLPVSLFTDRMTGLTPPERKRRLRRTAAAALIAGCFLFCASGLQQVGSMLTRDPGKTGFITSLYTVLTPLFALVLFRRRLSWNAWLGVGLAAVGLYLICLREGSLLSFGWGEALLLIGALFWAGHILVVDHFVTDIDPVRFSSWQFFTVGALSALASVIFENAAPAGVWDARWSILFCGALSVGVGFTLQAVGQRMLGDPTGSAIILSTESIFALVGGFLWNLLVPAHMEVDNDILPVGYVGCALVFLGIILTQITIPSLKRKKQTADPPVPDARPE